MDSFSDDQATKEVNDQPQIPDVAAEKMENSCPLSAQIFSLLQKFDSHFTRPRAEKLNEKVSDTPCSSIELPSTDEIMKMAREKLVQHTSTNSSIYSIFLIPSGLPPEIADDVDLALQLHASAKFYVQKQYGKARKWLSLCYPSASVTGNPVQRVVYYFAEALRDKIDKETGTTPAEESKLLKGVDVEDALMLIPTARCQQSVPFSKIAQFPGMQAVLDNVMSATRVHLIDLGIQSGLPFPIIMNALSNRNECPVELLKITAVGTSRQRIEETGKMLSSFAEQMNIPFQFNMVVLELKDLRKENIELEEGEVVAVYSEFRLWTMLPWPNRLEGLVRVIKSLKPSVMVVSEVEASTNTPSFMNRFDALLSYCSATFDCLGTCMKPDDKHRAITEGIFLREMIQNVIIIEGENRIQHARISFWREFFARFGIVETEFSSSSLYQADLLIQSTACWKSCSWEFDGKCLITKWKGTPVNSLSAWKFPHDLTLNSIKHR